MNKLLQKLRVKSSAEPILTEKGPWGIYDTIDKNWVGTQAGPCVYEDFEMACAANTIHNKKMVKKAYQISHRFRVRDIPNDTNKYVGVTEAYRDGAEAIAAIEKYA